MIPVNRRPQTHLACVLAVCIATACSWVTTLPPTVTPVSTAAAPATSAATAGPGSAAAASTIARNPSYSSPIAISDDGNLLVVANPLDGSVSVFNVAGDANAKLGEIQTGDEPRSVAITPTSAWPMSQTRAATRSQSSTWARSRRSPMSRSVPNRTVWP